VRAGDLIGARPELLATPPGPTRVRWSVLALFIVMGFVAYLLRTNMSVAGVRMREDLHLSQLQLGVVLAAFAWGYAICQLPAGVLGSRLGGRRTLALAAALWGVLNVFVAIVPGPAVASTLVIVATLVAARFLMGVAQAPLFPVGAGETIQRWFPVRGWALPNGLSNTGLTFGAAATGPVIAWLMERAGWRASFAITAPAGLVIAAWWWWYVRDVPAEHRAVNISEVALIDAHRPPASPSAPARGEWKAVLANRNVLLMTASAFANNYVFYFFFNWLYLYLVEVLKFEVLAGGYFAAAPWIAGAVGATMGGFVCDHLTQRIGITRACRTILIVGSLPMAGCILVAASARSPYVAVVFLSLCLASQQFTDSSFWAATTSVAGRQAAPACGVMNFGANASGGVGALLVPIVARTLGWPAALATAAIAALIGGILWLWISADPPPPA